MPALAALLAPLLLLSASARAENAVADRVDKELTRPALDEAAKMPETPGVRQLLKFFDDELIQPIFRSANAGGAARALGSADPGAVAAQGGGGGLDADAFSAKVMKLIGFGTADPLSLDLASNQVVRKKVGDPGQPPREVRPDSLKFVRRRVGR